ncbi:hypothetical protein BDZ45DRAFT_740720 [Acephala macrosclerotiorum]|nr:hypothetical protein BDZ45DRAFT_740720 [Acephala macrosclerotiorum]
MTDNSSSVPSVHLQPPSVDFIDNRLQDYHEAFRNPQTRYDPLLRRYVPVLPAATMLSKSHPIMTASEQLPQPRKLHPAVEAMRFWTFIFDDSMKKFKELYKEEPKRRAQDGYSIRSKTNWEDIYSQLQKARESYDGMKGFWGRVKKGLRTVADHSDPLQQGLRLVPENQYVSPILAAMEVLVDAVQKGADVRQEVTKAFDDKALEQAFGNIEVFFAIFPQDEPMKEASIMLVVAILKAIEDAIGFFISKQVARAKSALWRGEGYQKDLIESLHDIQTKSQELISEAQTSHIKSNSEAMNAILTRTGTISLTLGTIGDRVEVTIEKVNFIFEIGSKILANQDLVYNIIQRMLDDGEEQRKQNKQMQERIEELTGELRRAPSPFQYQWLPPPTQQEQLPCYQAYLQPLWQQQRPHAQPAQQLPYALPVQQLYPTWAMPQQPQQQQPYLDMNGLRDLLNIPDLDLIDIAHITETQNLIPARLRSRSEQLVTTPQFNNWLVLPKSRELLVHGDFDSISPNYISALSLLCATLTKAMRTRRSYISLVFFCGLHVEEDEGPVGGKTMVQSLIAQLLRQQFFDLSQLSQEIDIELVKKDSLGALSLLFRWLVRRIPQDLTLVCIIDGISHYENDDFEDDILKVLRLLLSLSRDENSETVVKILVTSPSTTDSVQEEFREDDACFVSMAELPMTGPQFGMLELESGLVDDEENSNDEDEDEDDD